MFAEHYSALLKNNRIRNKTKPFWLSSTNKTKDANKTAILHKRKEVQEPARDLEYFSNPGT